MLALSSNIARRYCYHSRCACACLPGREDWETAYHSFAPVPTHALTPATRCTPATCALTRLAVPRNYYTIGKDTACRSCDLTILPLLRHTSDRFDLRRDRVANRRKGPITQPRIYDDPTHNFWTRAKERRRWILALVSARRGAMHAEGSQSCALGKETTRCALSRGMSVGCANYEKPSA